MTWDAMFRSEMKRLLTHEEDMVPTLERLREQADGAHTHEILLGMVDATPSRLTRLDLVGALVGWEASTRTPTLIRGWRGDFEEVLAQPERGLVTDAMILSLVLRIARLRTAGYESAFLLAKNLEVEPLANLLYPMWNEDRESDDHISDVLAALISEGGVDLDERFRLRRV